MRETAQLKPAYVCVALAHCAPQLLALWACARRALRRLEDVSRVPATVAQKVALVLPVCGDGIRTRAMGYLESG